MSGPIDRLGRILLLVGVLSAVACHSEPPSYHSTAVSGIEWGQDFQLTSQQGEKFDTASLRGRVQVLFFGFTHCPDICAPTLQKLVAVMKMLGPDRDRVQVLFVSIDPEHDTPKQLSGFLSKFDSGFVGLTGKKDQVMAIARDHRIYADSSNGGIAHSGNLIVKNASGKVRLIVPESATVDSIASDLKQLLRE